MGRPGHKPGPPFLHQGADMSDTAEQTEEILPEEELPPEEILPEEESPEDGPPPEEDELPPEEADKEEQEGSPPLQAGYLEGTEQVTIEDIKVTLPEQDYHTLTLGQEQNGIRCLTIAKLRVKADIQGTGHTYDEAVPEVRLALLKMFVYELFAFVGEAEKAQAAYQDYSLIVKTSFGDIKTRTDAADDSGPAVAAMKAPARWSRHGC